MFLLIFYLNHFKAILAMFELVFIGALFDIVFEKFGNFDILCAEPAIGDEFALFC